MFFRHGMPVERHLGLTNMAIQMRGGQTDNDLPHFHIGHALCRIDGGANAVLSGPHINDLAGIQTIGNLMAETGNADHMATGAVITVLANQASDFRCADIQRGNRAAPHGHAARFAKSALVKGQVHEAVSSSKSSHELERSLAGRSKTRSGRRKSMA